MCIKPVLTSLLGLLLSISAFSQTVSVNNFTGSASVSIPLMNIKRGNVNVPFTLYYSGNGVKVKDVEGNAGLGWNIAVGGAVYRELRGLPDDARIDNNPVGGSPRIGWIYNTNGNKIAGFTVGNDNNTATCTDETTDRGYINSNFGDLSDTEPDIFHVNAPGLNCNLVFDKDHVIRTIPYQDIKVTYTTETTVPVTNAAYGRIKDFTITNSSGTKYYFAAMEVTGRKAVTSTTVSYFTHEYDQYKNGISYVSAWKLSQIVDLNRSGFTFTYRESRSTTSNTRIALAKGTAGVTYPFTYQVSTKQQVLQTIFPVDDDILTPGDAVRFVFDDAPTSGSPLISSIVCLGQGASFMYSSHRNMPYTSAQSTRSLLTRVSLTGARNYTFTYYGTAFYNVLPNSYDGVALPDSTSKEMDLWGYYNASSATALIPQTYINPSNGSLERYRVTAPGSSSASFPYLFSGVTRAVNPSVIANGSLRSVVSQYGGATTILYEPNDYYDPTAGATVQGGGIRVKQLITSDSTNLAADQKTSYTYINPATGVSSGKPVNLPVMAFMTPYTGGGTTESQWQNSTVRFEEDISGEDKSVFYSHVKVSSPGAGSTLYQYATPAMNWDNSAAPDWVPTVVNTARPDCNSWGFVSNQKKTYPFIPATNFDFERGIPQKVTHYNEDATPKKVSETSYTYQRNGTPVTVTGFKYEDNAGVMAYAKYNLIADVDEHILRDTTTVYELPVLANSRQTTTEYLYSSTAHRLPTTVRMTNSDGSITRQVVKYLKDYTTSTGGDDNNKSLRKLQLAGLNIPIENYSQVERAGVNKTIAASLVSFKPFSFPFADTLYLPAQQRQFLSADGVTDFQVSAITGGTSGFDSRYRVKQNNLLYSYIGTLLTIDNNDHFPKTVIKNPVTDRVMATFNNARADEVVFDDCETILETSLLDNIPRVRDSLNVRSGRYDLAASSADQLTRTVIRNPLAGNYILSLWVRSLSAGTITVSTIAGTTSTYTLNYVNSGTDWKYYEMKIPVSAISGAFTFKLQASGNMFLDDVLFYPEQAEVNTIAYNKYFLVESTTNTNGVSKYYEYSIGGLAPGLLKYIRDQDKNIIYKKSYMTKLSQDTYSPFIYIDPAGGLNYNRLVNFAISGTGSGATDGIKVTWNFGDGSPAVSGFNLNTGHVYRTAGTFTITATVESPFYGTSVLTQNYTITSSGGGTQIGGGGLGGDNGTIIGISVYQGGVLVDNLTQASLNAGSASLGQGIYTMVVYVNGFANSSSHPNGYRSVQFAGTGDYTSKFACQPSVSGATTYTFNIDLNGISTAQFSLNNTACPIVDPVE